MDPCPICYEEMDMREYRDPRAQTDTCYKLECGHAFHTKCVIGVLQQTQLKCPTCNAHKTPEGRARRERLALRALAHVRKNAEVRALHVEQKEAQHQLVETAKAWRKEVRDFAKQKAKEYRIKEKRDYYNKVSAALRNKKASVASMLGAIYREALRAHEQNPRNLRRWNHWRMVHPRVFVIA